MPPKVGTQVVVAENLTRAFGLRRAVDGISISLAEGDCLALFGPNGAGKTTLLRLFAGLLRPTEGKITIDGESPSGNGIRGKVGVISHHTMLYDTYSAVENVEFSARLYGVENPTDRARSVLQRMGAEDYMHLPLKLMSRGMQQRVSIARALVHGPSVILADEPFTGLDANGAAALTSVLREVRDAGACLIIVTHNLDEALSLCTQAAIMRKGRMVRVDPAPIADQSAYVDLYKELIAE